MKKYEIVKEHKEFDDIIANQNTKKNKYCIIYNKESNYEYPRFGIAVGKKVGNAVIRNRMKRKVRAIVTNNKNLFPKGKDYIIILKRSSLDISFQQLEKSILDLINE